MDNLLKQYHLLNDKEQNAILVYKSSMGMLINKINKYLLDTSDAAQVLQNPSLVEEARDCYEEFLEFYHTDPILKHTLLKNINMKSISTFIMSLIDISYTLDECADKIKTDQRMRLYRLVSYNDTYEDIAESEFVSTTGDINVCNAFMKADQNYILYEFDVDDNTPVMVCPYSIKAHYDSFFDYMLNHKPKSISIKEGDSQKEVILYKSRCNYDIMGEETIDKDGFHLKRIRVKVRNKKLEEVKYY